MAPRAEDRKERPSPRSSAESTRAPNTAAGATAPLPSPAEELDPEPAGLATRRCPPFLSEQCRADERERSA